MGARAEQSNGAIVVDSSGMRETMATAELSARQLTHRLIAKATQLSTPPDVVASVGGTPDDVALAVHSASERACRELSRSLGPVGFNALLTRALAQAEAEHPLLKEIRIGRNTDLILGDVRPIIQTHGAPAVAAALGAALETMFSLLGRLIGDDMVARLVDRSTPTGRQDDGDGT
jgi:hypothetical protein